MRSLTVVWTDSDDVGTPIFCTQLETEWQQGGDISELFFDAWLEHPAFGEDVDQIERVGSETEGRVLAVFEGALAPLYLAEGLR